MRVQLAEIDWEFFCKYYFPRHFSKPLGRLHRQMADDFTEALAAGEQVHEVIAFPREHGKTTWVSLALVLYCILFRKRMYIILLAQEHSQAKDYLADIKAELEDNERVHEDFGNLVGTPWQATEIKTATGIRVKPLGARMKLRGRKERHQRPDLIIADDLEDIVTAQNETERESRKTWVKRTVLRAGTDNTVFFFVGNKIHNDGVIAMLLENSLFRKREYKAIQSWPERQDLWDEWADILAQYPDDSNRGKDEARRFYLQHREEMDLGAQVAWPEGQPLYQLMLALKIGGRSAFYAEMQNEPIAPGDRLFTYKTYRSTVTDSGDVILQASQGGPAVKLSQCIFFYGVDPSLGVKGGDPSAIIVLARAPNGQLFVVAADAQRRTPYRIIEHIQSWHLKFPVTRCALEVVQFQALFATDAARESMQAKTYINYVQVPAVSNKQLRIGTLEPPLSLGYILLPEEGMLNLKDQLESWPNVRHDDILDGLELAYRVASTFSSSESPQIVEGEPYDIGDGNQFSPAEDLMTYQQADSLAHRLDVERAKLLGQPEPKELWLPKMRY